MRDDESYKRETIVHHNMDQDTIAWFASIEHDTGNKKQSSSISCVTIQKTGLTSNTNRNDSQCSVLSGLIPKY